MTPDRFESKNTRSGHLFANGILLCGSVLVVLIGTEAILHLLPHPPISNPGTALFCKDPLVRRLMRPNASGKQVGRDWGEVAIVANTDGYRDTAWSQKNHRTRVMLLGDSFGWGWGVNADKMLAYILEKLTDCSVYNLSIPGDGINDYYVRYNVYRHRLKPNAVVILTYINDFFQGLDSPWLQSRAEAAEKMTSADTFVAQCDVYPKELEDYLNASYLYRTVTRLRASGGISFSSEEKRRRAIRLGYTEDRQALSNNAAGTDAAFEVASRYFERMKEMGVPIIVAYIPPKYSVDHRGREQLQWALGDGAKDMQPELVEARLKALCQRLGLAHLNLRERLSRSGNPMYFEFDGHLNEEAQVVVAEALQARLVEMLASGDSKAGE